MCPGPGVNISTPVSFGVFNLPYRCLQGVTSCSVGSTDQRYQIFGDPYPGVAKHVSTFYLYMLFLSLIFF